MDTEEPKESGNKTTDTPAATAPVAAEKPVKDQAPKSDGKNMHVKVYAPFKTYFDDTALSVSAVNDTGPFDILPRHHNFMTLINQCEVSIMTETGQQKIPINRGVMHVKADRVDIFLDV